MRRIVSMALAASLAVMASVGASAAAAAEEGAAGDVVYDGSIAVRVTLDGAPTVANVNASATLPGGQTWAGASRPPADGIWMLENVPRSTDPATPIEIRVAADGMLDRSFPPCSSSDYLAGAATVALDSAATVEVSIALTLALGPAGSPATSDPRAVVHVVDEAGEPVAGATIRLFQYLGVPNTWTCEFETGPDGSVEVPLRAWGTAAEPSRLEVQAAGPQPPIDLSQICWIEVRLQGSVDLDVALADGSSPDPIVVATAPHEAMICQDVGAGSGPIALPETATALEPTPAADAGGPALAIAVLSLGLLAGWLVLASRRSRLAVLEASDADEA